jgi:hypothetical protein
MKNILVLITLCSLLAPSLAAKAKQAEPLTGSWECVAHGFPQGDMSFTLYLTQHQDEVTGWVASPLGSSDLTSVTFKNNNLEIHVDTPQGHYRLHGTYQQNRLSGTWSKDSTSNGKWEGKKISDSPDPK